MHLSVHPIVLTVALSGLAALVTAYFAWRASRLWVRAVCGLAALIFVLPAFFAYALFHPELIDPRFNAYKKFYADIREGMTRQEVFAIMDRRYPPTGPRLRPKVWSDETESLCFFMNPEPPEHEPNCEGIFLTLHEGHFVKKVYGAD